LLIQLDTKPPMRSTFAIDSSFVENPF